MVTMVVLWSGPTSYARIRCSSINVVESGDSRPAASSDGSDSPLGPAPPSCCDASSQPYARHWGCNGGLHAVYQWRMPAKQVMPVWTSREAMQMTWVLITGSSAECERWWCTLAGLEQHEQCPPSPSCITMRSRRSSWLPLVA